ncbi:uncharacterized protein LOC114268483 [Camellia sinensis]|uniref:uncharacterized protein LOC114268483 n=1 Tax=Camellia sinensis TaxID=4442 RepID=UPI001035E685|nr:uncharacterized protein LOC114268483 [Camellia sinensis]
MKGYLKIRNQKAKSGYHNDVGHKTEDYFSYKKYLDELAVARRLNNVLGEQQQNGQNGQQEENQATTEHLRGIIHVVHGVVHLDRIEPTREEMQKEAHVREVYKAEYCSRHKRPKVESSARGQVISFSEEDTQWLVQPHSDALIIKLDLDGLGVERILVDKKAQ